MSFMLVHIGIEINEGQVLAKVIRSKDRRTGKPLELLATGVGIDNADMVV